MEIFNQNMTILQGRNPSLADAVLKSVEGHLEVVINKNGDPVPFVFRDGKKMPLHSKVAPVKEAERFVENIDTESHDLYVVFGFAFAYHIEELLKKTGKEVTLLVVEKDIFILKAALESRDLSLLLGDRRLILLASPDEEEIADALKGKSSAKVTFITHRGSSQYARQYYAEMVETCRSYLSTKEVNIATLVKFERLWSANIMRNILYYTRCPGADIFYDRFKNIPALVIAAGPSLEESIEDIRALRNRAVLIAVDTAYRVLLKHGIEAHFCISVDAQTVNARYFEGVEKTDTILVADPMVHPSVFRLFTGRRVTFGIAFEMMKWIEKICGSHGEITHGGSVSTNAYDFASRLGCSPILMAGQDLAFTGGRAHVRGSYLDELVHSRTNRYHGAEVYNRRQVRALPPLLVPGIRTEKVETNQKMMIFRTWFARLKRKDLYNLTADGVRIEGVSPGAFSDFSFPEPGESPAEMRDHVFSSESSGVENAEEINEKLHDRVTRMLKELAALKPVLSRAVGFAENLAEQLQGSDRDGRKVDYILQKLDETDRLIASRKTIKDIISFSSQRTIHTINEGYDLSEGDSSLSEDVLVAKRSRYLYDGLLSALQFNEGILGKLLILLK